MKKYIIIKLFIIITLLGSCSITKNDSNDNSTINNMLNIKKMYSSPNGGGNTGSINNDDLFKNN